MTETFCATPQARVLPGQLRKLARFRSLRELALKCRLLRKLALKCRSLRELAW